MVMTRPSDLFDRVQAWDDLATFIRAPGPGLGIGVVSGRRRQGKSYLLRRAVAATGGLYHQAQILSRTQALARFSDDVARGLGLPPGAVAFSDWDVALRVALGFPGRGAEVPSPGASDPARVLVIDEVPYLLGHSPEIPSVLQELYDEAQSNPTYPVGKVIVCGSALSVMSELLSGSQPLRARAQLDLRIDAFDFRDAAAYWQIDDPEVAFRIDAVFGGTPGYRALVPGAPPTSLAELGTWLGTNVLNPAHALFSETDYLLREDPRIRDRHAYHAILAAVAAGKRSQKAIGGAIGRDHNQLRHPLETLVRSGFLIEEADVLTQRQPLYFLADPIVRFEELVTAPCRPLLEERDVAAAWNQSTAAFSTGVLGPHFEHICATWTRKYAGDRFGAPLGQVGPAVINDTAGRSQHQLDAVGIERSRRRGKRLPRVLVIGEAKSSNRPRTTADLDRLDRIRDLLQARGVPAADAHLALFGRSGFDSNLLAAAGHRRDVHLVTLTDLYAQP